MEQKVQVMTISPLFDRILLEPVHHRQNGAIQMPESTTQTTLTMARVLLAGPGKMLVDTGEFLPTQVKEGELVFINSYLGSKIKIPPGTKVVVQSCGKEVELSSKIDYLLQQEDALIARLTPVEDKDNKEA